MTRPALAILAALLAVVLMLVGIPIGAARWLAGHDPLGALALGTILGAVLAVVAGVIAQRWPRS